MCKSQRSSSYQNGRFQINPSQNFHPGFTRINPLPLTLPQFQAFRAPWAIKMPPKEMAALPTRVTTQREQRVQSGGSGCSNSHPFLSTWI